MEENTHIDATAHVVDEPWGDGSWVVLGNGDPHVSRFLASCDAQDAVGDDHDLDDDRARATELARRWNAVPALEAERDALHAELVEWFVAGEAFEIPCSDEIGQRAIAATLALKARARAVLASKDGTQ